MEQIPQLLSEWWLSTPALRLSLERLEGTSFGWLTKAVISYWVFLDALRISCLGTVKLWFNRVYCGIFWLLILISALVCSTRPPFFCIANCLLIDATTPEVIVGRFSNQVPLVTFCNIPNKLHLVEICYNYIFHHFYFFKFPMLDFF